MERMHAQLEGVLFSEGGEMSNKALAGLLGITEAELAHVVHTYNAGGRGLVLITDAEHTLMRPAEVAVPLIAQLRKEEESTPLSKASLEVLAVVLYKGGATASEVEYIRGVNSGYSLRHLTTRGLLLKSKDGGSYRYTPTAELLAHLGVTSVDALPAREEFLAQMAEFTENYEGTH